MTGNRSQLINYVHKFLGTIRFSNDQIAKITSYGDYQLGNVTITQVYYVEGLGHNLFSIGQFCDSDLKKPDLSYLRVFGALCYPTNDSDDLGKLQLKAVIEIFIGYARAKKVFRIYNKKTRMIIETIHEDFDELTAMASEQFSSGPRPQQMTLGTLSSGLVPNPPSSTPVVFPVPAVAARRRADPTDSPVSTSIDQDVPSSSNPSIQA
ncbi:hypothetical protein Tco_1179914 [Tanacetum coccineum]